MENKDRKLQVSQEEVVQLFLLLEALNSFFHQPLNYQNVDDVKDFINSGTYKQIAEAYYETVWNWLPYDIQKSIEDR